MKRSKVPWLLPALPAFLAAASLPAGATIVSTTDAGAVAAFQQGLSVVDFESVAGVTAQPITAYTAGDATSAAAGIFDQLPNAQFSVGGMVGTNVPLLFQLGGAIAGDAHSGSHVMGPVFFDGTTEFGQLGSQIEIYFPTKIASVGFWLNPSLGNVNIIALDTNFAFSHENETVLESASVTAGNFVGIHRDGADIGGFKIISTDAKGFTLDDFSYGTAAPVPEPAAASMLAAGLAVLGWLRRRAR